MPFTTEITNIKSEINSGLAASQYTAKDLVYVSKAIEALAAAETSEGVFNTATVSSILYVGPGASAFATSLTNPIGVFTISNNDYAQLAIKNSSSGSNASSDFLAYANNGSDTTGWIDMGITSSTFTDPDFTITGANDGYIFMSAPQGTSGHGNLVIATDDTGTQNKIVFAAGGLSSNDTQMVITPDVNVHIEIPTPSTSPSTGALTVVGGVGVQGDVNIQGAITFGGTGTTVSAANLSVTDPIVFVGNNNAGDAVDLGLVGEYTSSSVKKYAGVVRDATDGVMKFFKDATTKPSSTVNFSGAGLTYASIKVNGIEASSANITSATIGSVTNTEIGYLSGVTSAIQTQLGTKLDSTTASTTYAPLASPSLTGTPVAPTAAADTNTTQIATTAYVVGQGYLKSTTASSTYAPLIQTPDATKTFTSNNYTLVAGDKDKILLLSNGSTSGNVTVPSGIFAVGSVITVVQTGTGQLTLTASGTTLNSQGAKLKLNGQYASCQIICTASNTFLIIGNLAA